MGEAGQELLLPLPGRPRDSRTQLPSKETVGKLRPRVVDTCQNHSEFVAKTPSPTPWPTAGLPGSGTWRLTIIWSLQDQVPCGPGPTILSTGYGDAAWAEMRGKDSQSTVITVTAHTHSGSSTYATVNQLYHPFESQLPPPTLPNPHWAALLGGLVFYTLNCKFKDMLAQLPPSHPDAMATPAALPSATKPEESCSSPSKPPQGQGPAPVPHSYSWLSPHQHTSLIPEGTGR